MAELGPRARKAERRHAQATETALSACQEELARMRKSLAAEMDGNARGASELVSAVQKLVAAEAARDELARAIEQHREKSGGDGWNKMDAADHQRLYAALSSEATKGKT